MSREDLEKRLAYRGERIRSNLASIRSCLPDGVDAAPPTATEVAAITWWLGGIYNEMEEVLKGISAHYGEPEPTSPSWHKGLLQQMATSTSKRQAVLTDTLRDELDALRAFRHFSRNATALDPDWLRMQPLLASLDVVAERFLAEVSQFVASA